MNAGLCLEGLVAGYGSSMVLRGVDIHVGPGEVVALLGANGAGKTTTLLAASGLLRLSQGRVTVDGRHVDGRRSWRVARNGLVLVPEGRCLFSQLTARQNLQLAQRRRGPGLESVLEIFPLLQPLLGRRTGLLSGGEQQMLAVARGLLMEPRYLLVDELSLGLAPLMVRDLLQSLRRVASESGVGVMVVEQHVVAALAVADRGCVLRRGEVVLEGPAQELLDRQDQLSSTYLGGAVGD